MCVFPSHMRLQSKFMLFSSIGVAALVLCASLAFGWLAKKQTDERLQILSTNELNSLHALVLSVMEKRAVDKDDVAVSVFNRWFKARNADYPGKLWSAWGPKVVAYMATQRSPTLPKLPRDEIDREAVRTGKPVARFVGDTYRYSMPIVLGVTNGANQKICMNCHGDLMGIRKGDVVAVFSSSLPTAAATHKMWRMAAIISGCVLLAGIAILFVLRILFGRVVSKPLCRITGTMGSLAKGDLDVFIPFADQFDELGDMARAVQVFKQNLIHNRELVSRIKTTNGELECATAKLKDALAVADAASQTKSNFLAAMSHELRTPLVAIMGFSEILKDQMLGPIGNKKYAGYAADIFNSGAHLLQLINDILDLCKSDARQLTLNDDVVDLNEIATFSTRFVEPQAARAKVRLTVDTMACLPHLRADPRRLRQIVINLVSNAVKFTPEGGKVRVSAARRDGGLAVVVCDTGIGIAPGDIETALARFGQIDSKLSRKYDGTGLGLPITKELVELHGGTLAIESAVGVGTTVTVWFPPERVLSHSPEIPVPGTPVDMTQSLDNTRASPTSTAA